MAVRSDGETFSMVATPEGPRVIGDYEYLDFGQSREYWTENADGEALCAETLAIIDHFERIAPILGIDKPVAPELVGD
jgi:hypothetical protein